ncbi:hypothetical protein OEZ85_004833 [Tetradesmus obliquus]|uniref:BZIP domain-containing protein n=1 Tax=Tetradesmus obliquus TaxID=3088 RepID=A0ABY8UGZ3_TETOB|nr:hypothetical protein OEZ85_004833 [Tetradesmus obliquus]
MAAMILQELESSINSTEGEERHAAANGWASLLPPASGTVSPSAAAGCYTAPIDHTCAGAGQYPEFTALMQRRDSCAGGSSTLHCASPSSAPAFSTGGPKFLCTSDDSSMPCGDAAAAAAAIVAAAPASGAPAVAANTRRGAAQANERRLRQKQADASNAKEQVASLSAKVASLQAKLDSQRGETSQLLARLADVTSKWQATVLENASLNAKNGELQAQLGEVQHAAAMVQRERDELRRALQQQPALCAQVQQQQHSRQMQLALLQQQQQQVAWAAPGEHGVHHAAGAAHWAQW